MVNGVGMKSVTTETHPQSLTPMKITFPTTIAACLILGLTLGTMHAQTISSQQNPSRPFGLDITDQVYIAASDADSADFQVNALPALRALINEQLGERQSLSDVASVALDPSKLRLDTSADVRVYFVSEGAGYHNTLGINTDGIGITTGNPELIFPDASSRNTYFADGSPDSSLRTSTTPLLPGDFVDLGSFEANTQLDFFLIANGANGGQNVFTAHDDSNPDGIAHTVSFAIEGSPYLLIGFEDIYGGGDRDFNDLLFAVDIGAHNVNYLANPEPSTMIILASLAGLVIRAKRKSQQKLAAPAPVLNV